MDDFYLTLGKQTNALAQVLADRLKTIPDCRIAFPVESNVVMLSLPKAAYKIVAERYQGLMIWNDTDPEIPNNVIVRFMANYCVTEAQISETVDCVRKSCGRL